MANKIQVKRGVEANLPVLDVGEPAFTTDTKKPFIGSDIGNVELATKTQLDAVASGSPKGVFATVTDLTTAFPTGNTNIYLVTADGNWYYWNGSNWVAGGVYQSTFIPDDSVDTINIKDSSVTKRKLSSDVINKFKGDNVKEVLKANNRIKLIHNNVYEYVVSSKNDLPTYIEMLEDTTINFTSINLLDINTMTKPSSIMDEFNQTSKGCSFKINLLNNPSNRVRTYLYFVFNNLISGVKYRITYDVQTNDPISGGGVVVYQGSDNYLVSNVDSRYGSYSFTPNKVNVPVTVAVAITGIKTATVDIIEYCIDNIMLTEDSLGYNKGEYVPYTPNKVESYSKNDVIELNGTSRVNSTNPINIYKYEKITNIEKINHRDLSMNDNSLRITANQLGAVQRLFPIKCDPPYKHDGTTPLKLVANEDSVVRVTSINRLTTDSIRSRNCTYKLTSTGIIITQDPSYNSQIWYDVHTIIRLNMLPNTSYQIRFRSKDGSKLAGMLVRDETDSVHSYDYETSSGKINFTTTDTGIMELILYIRSSTIEPVSKSVEYTDIMVYNTNEYADEVTPYRYIPPAKDEFIELPKDAITYIEDDNIPKIIDTEGLTDIYSPSSNKYVQSINRNYPDELGNINLSYDSMPFYNVVKTEESSLPIKLTLDEDVSYEFKSSEDTSLNIRSGNIIDWSSVTLVATDYSIISKTSTGLSLKRNTSKTPTAWYQVNARLTLNLEQNKSYLLRVKSLSDVIAKGIAVYDGSTLEAYDYDKNYLSIKIIPNNNSPVNIYFYLADLQTMLDNPDLSVEYSEVMLIELDNFNSTESNYSYSNYLNRTVLLPKDTEHVESLPSNPMLLITSPSSTVSAKQVVPIGTVRKVDGIEPDSLGNVSTKVSHLHGKTLICFGDSITGNAPYPTDYPTKIAINTGMNVINMGFGGCRMGKHSGNWDKFSMYSIAESIKQSDYTSQELAAVGVGLPDYFPSRVEVLKSLDFNTIDYVTIAYGTNDWGNNPTTDSEDPFDINTFPGALRKSLITLLEAYPHLNIMLITPMYRWFPNNDPVDDSDTFMRNGTLLVEYVDCVKKVAEEFKLPVYDAYRELGINKYNRLQYFSSSDGTHHNENGRMYLGSKFSAKLKSIF